MSKKAVRIKSLTVGLFALLAFMLIFGVACIAERTPNPPDEIIDGTPDDPPETFSLIVNQVYGMGSRSNDEQAVSNSFVELYNKGDAAVDLNGFSVQASGEGAAWQKLELSGIILPKHSFLIVLTRFTNTGGGLHVPLTAYDLAWDAFFTNRGVKVVLLKSTALLTVKNPFNTDGQGNKALGYVDMLAAAGNESERDIDGFETDYLGGNSSFGAESGVSKQRAVRRMDFADTDNNALDAKAIDYRIAANQKYRPRSLADGAWTQVQDLPVYLDNTFPAIHINTFNIPITSRTTYVPAAVRMENSHPAFMFNNISAGIRGRGNSTWTTSGKQPFRLRFDDQRSIFDSDYRARSWVLLANAFDKSMLRNYGALHVAKQLSGFDFTSNAWFVDLYLNGQYRGVYLICDQIQENTGRVELTYNADPEKSEYLLNRDSRAASDTDAVLGITYMDITLKRYEINFPGNSGSPMTLAHADFLTAYITQAELAMQEGDFAQVLRYIDLNSFVDWIIFQEFFKGSSAHNNSVYFSIRGQGESRRIFMGPIWDSDLSLGNYNVDEARRIESGLYAAVRHEWFIDLLKIPQFFDAVKARFLEVKETILYESIKHLSFMATYFRQAFEKNFTVWNILIPVGSEPSTFWAYSTHSQHTDYVLWYLNFRLNWLSNNFFV
ncbi:MAG: CotH kinase family protein [Firmicutes bacterium]|nr:CotH kinase family protein [Bacillota bacterium]